MRSVDPILAILYHCIFFRLVKICLKISSEEAHMMLSDLWHGQAATPSQALIPAAHFPLGCFHQDQVPLQG